MPPGPTQRDIDHYRAFGFVVLRGTFTADEVVALGREADTELAAQYRATPFDGSRRHFCCMNDDQRTPTFATLLQDERFLDGGEALHGGELTPMWCDANRYSHDTHWHPDLGGSPRSIEFAGIKFAIYLEPLDGDSGALRVVPGSHRQPQHDAVRDFLARHPDFPADQLPATVCVTAPGDVVAFHHALFHAACHARAARRLCTLAYYAQTGRADDRATIAGEIERNIASSRAGFGWTGEVFPAAWLARAAGDPRRRRVVERLHAGGLVAAAGGDVARTEAALRAAEPLARFTAQNGGEDIPIGD